MDKLTVGAVTTLRRDIDAGYSEWSLLISDLHYDSIYCDRDALQEDLELAMQRNASIYMFGDIFDAMQGRFDPRRSMDELRPEFRSDRYFDLVVKDLAKFFKPYAKNIELIADGNHETSIIRHNNTSLLDRLIDRLNDIDGVDITHGGYGGWIVYLYTINKTVRTSIRMKYFHGSGGGGPVTRGVIQTNRQSVYLPDADIIVNGHTHDEWYMPITRERVSDQGIHYFDIVHHIRLAGYKNAYGDGTTGWEVTRGGAPKPIGGAWINKELSFKQNVARNRGGTIDITVIAKPRPPTIVESVPGLYEGVIFPEETG